MIRRRFVLLALPLTWALAATTTPAGAVAQAADRVSAASLEVTPDEKYQAGQELYWTGNIGAPGVREILMEKHLGCPSCDWSEVEYFVDQTDADGNFGYWWPAPAMRSIEFRVVSGPLATPAIELSAEQQDLVLWVSGSDPADPTDIGEAEAGVPFGISVDTTPVLVDRPDTRLLQPIPGRELTLQRRVDGTGDKWDTLGTSVVETDGMGYFRGVVEDEPGEVVYRVRQEDWFEGHNEIGWFPSFPTYITISAPGASAGPAMAAPISETAGTDAAEAAPVDERTAAPGDGWAPFLYDFAWAYGESLTSPPYHGTKREGWWLDYSDGGGRLAKNGGGLMLDSKRIRDPGPGDFGTTMGTVQDNAQKYGRWEVKMKVLTEEASAQDYELRMELVPDRAQDDSCRTITIGSFTAHGDTVDFGANAVTKQWTGSKVMGELDGQSVSYAIEVSKKHITWFINDDAVGTVKNKKAISGVPLTLRISLVGDGQREMNRTEALSDFQRAWTLKNGPLTKDGAPLREDDLTDC